MGYRVSSVLAIAAEDPHSHFLDFLPTRRVRYEWINDWVASRFDSLAAKLGPDAVIVTAPVGREEEFWRSMSRTQVELMQSFQPDRRYADPGFLHSGWPFLVVSRRPLAVPAGPPAEREHADFAAVNLAEYAEPELGVLLDELVERARAGADLLDAVPSLMSGPHAISKGSDWHFDQALELKPNVFGIGLNVNAIFASLRSYRARRG